MGEFAAWAYARAVAERNRRFDRGIGVVELDRPVISIGNLSVGGTGKSPMVAWVLRMLIAAGHRPCVAMRGYRARKVGSLRVSDEAQEYAKLFGNAVPVVAQPNRVQGLRDLFATPRGSEVDSVVLDDGFQHRKLARRCDVVLIDATRDPFDERPLPAGLLREPIASLKRATSIVITHAESAAPGFVNSLSQRLAEVTGREPIAIARHDWSELRVIEHGQERAEPVSWLESRTTFLACAIGNPGPLLQQTRSRSRMVGAMLRRDHDRFRPRVVARIVEHAQRLGADTILCTSKDWTKLSDTLPATWTGPIVIPRLSMSFDRGEADLAQHIRASVSRPVS